MQHRKRPGWLLLTTLAALWLAACQPVRPTPASAPELVATPALAPAAAAMAQASVDFVAATRGLAPDALRVIAAEAVNWPDAALGCPQPDMIYAAVITPGYRIVLATADAAIVVHTDSRLDGEKVICPEE